MKMEDEIMIYWKKGIQIMEKMANCNHEAVMWGADGKTGICVMCGATVRRK